MKQYIPVILLLCVLMMISLALSGCAVLKDIEIVNPISDFTPYKRLVFYDCYWGCMKTGEESWGWCCSKQVPSWMISPDMFNCENAVPDRYIHGMNPNN
jgi:hypothetical protein